MKVALILACLAVALPSIADAFFFGVTFTDAAGLALAAADPTQTGVIITLGVIGASLAFAGGALLSALAFPPEAEDYYVSADTGYGHGKSASSASYARTSSLRNTLRRNSFRLARRLALPPPPPIALIRRGKRAAEEEVIVEEVDINGIFDTIFVDIGKSKMVGCFERLVCDIAARPEDYPENVPIVKGVQLIDAQYLTNEASLVSHKLQDALVFGQNITDITMCEQTYSNCHWSGQQMDQVISMFDKQVTIEP